MTKSGKLYVVGIGPGSYEDMTIRAVKALEESEIIVGYTVYIDLIKDHFPGKEMLSTPMRREQERCGLAIDEAKKGKITAMVCSGDSGVYGMSGLILEMARSEEGLEIEIIPGVTAALSGGAVLGAPLGHDFAVISLSDLLTPMELIEERLKASAQADMVICLYNPSSKKRADYLKRACEIVMEFKSRSTVCGLVKNIGRNEEEMAVMTLENLRDTQTDMFTTVYIGNSMTKLIDGRMVTPRGYKNV
ncbi:precorrin-3B C(17)-methyltransferase [Lacrimispora indolis]|uniref:precorrin-3B C(17)-methyltransferase n=1 Tax=Lacrimispora indolis TaxID=69825 RepID=UPI00040EF6A3|nr:MULTISPECIES: precorrin-3B C(17)-methyltransferase [Lachnospiraceae]MBE7722235.1 precorrin-3B C(17)-methyltransferase [Lacrimispora celerecrescens]